MKKLITFILVSFLVTIKLMAVTTNVTVTTGMTTTDLNTAITTAKSTSTDITLQFACGSTFNYAGSALTVPTGVTKLTFASTGTGSRPVINLDQIIYSDAAMTDGLFFDGVQLYSAPASTKTLFQPASATFLPAKLSINNCWVEGYKVVFYAATAGNVISNVTMSNSTFYNIGGGGGTPSGIISTGSTALVNNISITNNTFIDCHTGSRYFLDHRTTNITNATFNFSNNTCYYSIAQSSNGALRLGASPAAGLYTLSNNIFSLSASVTAASLKIGYTTGYTNLSGTGNYYSGNFNGTTNPYVTFTQYSVAPTTLFTSPGTSTSSNFTINDPNFSAKITAGNANCYYPETVMLNGNTSNISLSQFSYTEGAGPSTSTSFTISAYVPRSVITLTAPTNFEISTNNSTFSSSLTVGTANTDLSSQTIYVRLKSGLTNASSPFSGNVAVTTTTGTSKTVACSGVVSAVALTPLSTPTNLVVSSPSYTGSFHAAWDAVSNADSYTGNVYQGVSVVKSFTASSTSTDITGLTQGSTYTFTVTAIGSGSYSNSSESSKSGSVTIPAAPTVSSLTPSTGTTIQVNGTISVVFNENVSRNSSNDITLGGATVSESNIAISGATVTITYSGLSYNNNSCGLLIPAGAFKSASSNAPTAVSTTATFITPDNIAPTTSKISISGGATMPVNGFISLVMSEPCKAGSASVTIGSKTITAAISSSNSNLVYVNYSGLAYDTDYTMTIPTNAITDITGNSYAGTTITFHTEVDAKGTQLFSFTPDATSIPGSSSGTVTQTVNGYTISFAAVQNAGARAASPYTYAFKTNSVTLPTLPSVGELSFYIQSGGGSSPQEYYLQKLGADNVTWTTIETFVIGNNDRTLIKTATAQSSIPTTLRMIYNSANLWFYFIDVYQYNLNGPVDDGLNPSVSSTTPAASSTNAPINGSIKLNCSENVVLGSGSITLNGVTLTPAIVGKTITLPYTNLQYSTSYTLSVPAGAFLDLFNHPCAAFTLSFTTMDHPSVTKKGFDFVVGVDGNFSAAIAAATAASGNRFRIFFPNGSYNIGSASTADANQMTTMALPNVSYIGQSSSGVTLYNQPTSEGIGTTATIHLTSAANNVYMQDLTLSNNYPYDGSTGRAVALWDQGTKNIYKNVTLLSHQDTYYSGSNIRSYFEGGSIHGTVDFLCGGGDVFFNETQLYLEDRTGNVITASSTSTSYGYVFSGCTIDGASSADGNFYLGRPWQNSPRVAYINTKMNILPAAIGWTTMGSTPPTKFGEYNSTNSSGNPLNLSSRMTTYTYNAVSTTIDPYLTSDQAAAYTIDNVLGGGDAWQPQQSTGQATVPVISGNGSAISWSDNSYVSCWGIFKDGVFVTFVTTNSYNIPYSVTSGTYTVRAANEMGGLSAVSNSYAFTATTQATDYFRSKATGNASDASSWESSSDNSTWISATLAPLAGATSVTILNGHTISVNSNLILSNLILNSGSIVNVNSDSHLTVTTAMTNNGTLNLLSDATGTATILTPPSISGSGIANVQQYVSTGRNWYISSPVTGATSATFSAATLGNIVYWYDESKGNTTPWQQISDNTTSLTVMKGYVYYPVSSGAVTFSGSLNTGNQSISVSRTSGQSKEGFNLIGNPYASYLNWSQVSRGNLSSSMWYRTKSAPAPITGLTAYVFDTYNVLSDVATNNGAKPMTKMIPPMQSFWVRVADGQTHATITATNTQRGFIDISNNGFRSKQESAIILPIVRLDLSNGSFNDQTVIYTDTNAQNSLDEFDSPKMFNNSASVAEIFTIAGNENLAINGLNSIQYDTEMPLGFNTATAGTFSIKASEFINFADGTQLILKDYLTNNVIDLSNGLSYSFNSEAETNNISRFSLIFRAPSISTDVNYAQNGNVWISLMDNNQIVVNGTNGETNVAVYNEVGQRLVSQHLTASSKPIGKFVPGVYLVTVTNAGKSTTAKVIIK